MVAILSSLKSVFGPEGAEAIRIPARSTEPLAFPTPPRRERSSADLARMIESEIIPRLMLAHGSVRTETQPEAAASVGPRTLEVFARMTLSSEVTTLTAYVETLVQGGLPLRDVYVDLLIPTAQRLDDDWDEDLISFTDVTVGLGRLQRVVRMLEHSIPIRDADADAPTAYFAAAAHERHAFGVVVLEDYFRRAGWRTTLDTMVVAEEAAETVGHQWFDVFGLSATFDTPTKVIASTIALARQASRNPRLFVMLGGRRFLDDPALASALGADAGSATADNALIMAHKAIRPLAVV